jgi:hypothetical protein
MKSVKDDTKRTRSREACLGHRWSQEMEVSAQAKTVELIQHWLAETFYRVRIKQGTEEKEGCRT